MKSTLMFHPDKKMLLKNLTIGNSKFGENNKKVTETGKLGKEEIVYQEKSY